MFLLHRKKHFNRAIKSLLLTNALVRLSAAMLGPIYALFVEKVGGSLLDASFAGATLAVVAGLTVLITGRTVDKVTYPAYVLIVGYVLIGAGFLLYTIVGSIWQLLLVQVVIGLGEAVASPAFDALYSKHLDGHIEGKEWGAWEAMNYFTLSVGAIIGGFIATNAGFSTLFMVMAALCLLSIVYILILPKKML